MKSFVVDVHNCALHLLWLQIVSYMRACDVFKQAKLPLTAGTCHTSHWQRTDMIQGVLRCRGKC